MKRIASVTIGICLVGVLSPFVVFAGGNRERGTDGQNAPVAQTVDVPDWVVHIQTNNYAALHESGNESGYIGIGLGSTREEALAAAAVDFAGNVSTEVDASVIESGDAQSEEGFDVRIESEVRSQAIVSGLEPLVWEDPRTDIVYALYRASVEEYRQRLREWTSTMATISEAERAREIQRLEDERAAAERRQKEIELETLRDQVRLADRQMRADRHRTFLYMAIPSREQMTLTPYYPEIGEITGGFRGGFDEFGIDASFDQRLGKIFRFGLNAEGVQKRNKNDDEDDDAGRYSGAVTGRLDVRLLDRVGWVTSTSIVAGAYGGGYLDGEWEPEWAAGPYLSADVIVPELWHTRWGVYAGTDLVHLRTAWYPFWNTIEDAIGLHVAGQVTGRNLLPPGDDYITHAV